MAYKRNVEIFEEAYTKKDDKSVISYVSRDGKKRYIPGSEDPNVGPSGGGMTEVTWQELKDKRDAGELTPGSLYRITDYNCTTTQENTQSAGHQFDIVLLALSENKLAEEGWAMMNDNIYDVTFMDGVTKKCYLYKRGDSPTGYNIVDVNTLLGIDEASLGDEFTIDEETKTANCTEYDSPSLRSDNLPYNYFQNSNLSAWKVWYCLDNDTSRFAWAQQGQEGNVTSVTFKDDRNESHSCDKTNTTIVKDNVTYYYWQENNTQVGCLTASPNPNIGDTCILMIGDEDTGDYSITAITGTPQQDEGRGVIFRLIDEWNNDCPYDFKNIQFLRPLTDGMYDESGGTNTWCYTTGETALDIDLSIWHYPTHDLYISSNVDIGVEEDTCKYFLPNNVFLIPASSKLYGTTGCTMMGAPLEMRNCRNVILGEGVSAGVYINCFEMSDTDDEKASFYFNNKVVILDTLGSDNSGGARAGG